jgi:hypothetical protein
MNSDGHFEIGGYFGWQKLALSKETAYEWGRYLVASIWNHISRHTGVLSSIHRDPMETTSTLVLLGQLHQRLIMGMTMLVVIVWYKETSLRRTDTSQIHTLVILNSPHVRVFLSNIGHNKFNGIWWHLAIVAVDKTS